MHEHVEKPKENKSRSAANSIAQKKSSAKQTLGFVDKRSFGIFQMTPMSAKYSQRKSGVMQMMRDDEDVAQSPNESGALMEAKAIFETIAEGDYAKKGGDQLKMELSAILKNYVCVVNYNSLEERVRFIDHMEQGGEKEDFNPKSLATLDFCNGGQCVAQALELAHNVTELIGVTAYPIAAMLSQYKSEGIYTHGAAMVAFSNPSDLSDTGFVLLDPGFNVDEPIVIKAASPGKLRQNELKLSEDGEKILSISKDKEVQSEFTARRKITNPDQAISAPALDKITVFSIVSRATKDKLYIKLDISSGVLEIQFAKNKKTSFDMHSKKAEIVNWFEKIAPENFVSSLGYPDAGSLMYSLNRVWDYHAEIQEREMQERIKAIRKDGRSREDQQLDILLILKAYNKD